MGPCRLLDVRSMYCAWNCRTDRWWPTSAAMIQRLARVGNNFYGFAVRESYQFGPYLRRLNAVGVKPGYQTVSDSWLLCQAVARFCLQQPSTSPTVLPLAVCDSRQKGQK